MPPTRPKLAPAPRPGHRTLVGQGLLTAGLFLGLAGLWLTVAAALDDAPTADFLGPLLGLLLMAAGLALGAWGWKLAPEGQAPRPRAEPRGPGRVVEARVVGWNSARNTPLTPEFQHACGAWNEAGSPACRGCGEAIAGH